MQEHCDIRREDRGGIPVFTVSGYLGEDGGRELLRQVTTIMKDGGRGIILDLGPCKIISSPGVGFLLNTALKVVDDFKGRIIVTGLNAIKESLMTMSGIIPIVSAASTVDIAIEMFDLPG